MSQEPHLFPELPGVIAAGFYRGLEGWISEGRIEAGGRAGGLCLAHGAGVVESTRVATGLTDGWYTLRVWVKTNLTRRAVSIAISSGGVETRTFIPVAPDQWIQGVVSARVTDQQCTIHLKSDAAEGETVYFGAVELVPGRAVLSMLGADISSLKKSEDRGGIYADEAGRTNDALAILYGHGMNYARFRVWLNSPDGYHGKSQLLEMAKRVKLQGMNLLVDFHYSDGWADPGQQNKPAAWANLDFEGLKRAVYDHTREVCVALAEQGTPADMVQVGNEINNGMLWPDGKNDKGFDNLAALLKEGIRAVRESLPQAKVMLHLAEGGNNPQFHWWLDAVNTLGVQFDVLGVSYYPRWHGSLADLQANLHDIAARYARDIVLVETSYPFTVENNDDTENILTTQDLAGYPTTPAGQADFLADVMTIVRSIPGGRGLGVFWWDATWTAVKGNGWDARDETIGNNYENQALFDYQNRVLPALNQYKNP